MRKVAYASVNYGNLQCYASSKPSLFRINSKISNSLILDYEKLFSAFTYAYLFYNFLNQIFRSSSLIFLKAPSTVRCVCDSHVPPLQIPTIVGASPISRLFYGADLDWLWNSRYASLRICSTHYLQPHPCTSSSQG